MRVHRLDPAAVDDMAATLRDELADRPEVCFAYLFGSVLEAAGFRDVDVALWTAPEAGRDVDLDVARHLTRRLQLPVDVRRINDAPVSFLFHVLRGRPLVVRDDVFLANLIERTAREYHDRAPMLRRATREAFAAMTLDADVVRTRCQEIEQSLERLARLRTMTREAFLRDEDARDIACSRLLIAIEAALALCYHVSARRLRSVPEDYAGCFDDLQKAGVITLRCRSGCSRWRASGTCSSMSTGRLTTVASSTCCNATWTICASFRARSRRWSEAR